MRTIPSKLKNDAIAEAIFELRFGSAEVPEVVLGRLADRPDWRTYQNVRLPFADIPSAIRLQTPEMKFQPVMELRSQDQSRVVKIGSNAISYHVTGRYPGWAKFRSEIHVVVDHVMERLAGAKTDRLGLRYVNLLTEREHNISGLFDLHYSLAIAGQVIDVPQMVNFEKIRSGEHVVTVRLASPKFVLGVIEKPFTALVDVDVYTPDNYAPGLGFDIKSWLEQAHTYEKEEFFDLLTEAKIEELRES